MRPGFAALVKRCRENIGHLGRCFARRFLVASAKLYEPALSQLRCGMRTTLTGNREFTGLGNLTRRTAYDALYAILRRDARPRRRSSGDRWETHPMALQQGYDAAASSRANRMCRDGGIDLQHFISTCGPGEYQFFCEGYEGSRERGRPRVTAAGTDSGSERQIVWPSTA